MTKENKKQPKKTFRKDSPEDKLLICLTTYKNSVTEFNDRGNALLASAASAAERHDRFQTAYISLGGNPDLDTVYDFDTPEWQLQQQIKSAQLAATNASREANKYFESSGKALAMYEEYTAALKKLCPDFSEEDYL